MSENFRGARLTCKKRNLSLQQVRLFEQDLREQSVRLGISVVRPPRQGRLSARMNNYGGALVETWDEELHLVQGSRLVAAVHLAVQGPTINQFGGRVLQQGMADIAVDLFEHTPRQVSDWLKALASRHFSHYSVDFGWLFGVRLAAGEYARLACSPAP